MENTNQQLTSIERLVRRERLATVLALSLVTLFSWAYLFRTAQRMPAMSRMSGMQAAMGMADASSWGVAAAMGLFVMWAVMMAGMMLPSASPVILMVNGLYRRRGGKKAQLCTVAFTGGYLAAWTGFSVAAALAQIALHRASLMSSAMVAQSSIFAGGVFVIAGVYQWAPVKQACLSRCRSPIRFLSEEWREGIRGAFSMGLRHGLFCVGCCWALMAILFAAGVMNLFWVALLTAFVLVEKLLPWGRLIEHASGVLLILWGAYLLAQTI